MLVTAIVKDNNLIIPNIDVSQLPTPPNEFGMVQFDLAFLTAKPFELPKSVMQTDNQLSKKQYSVTDLAGSLSDKTDKKATIEEMNDSIAQAYRNWEC